MKTLIKNKLYFMIRKYKKKLSYLTILSSALSKDLTRVLDRRTEI